MSHRTALNSQRKPDILSTTVQFCIQPAAGFAAAAPLLMPRRFIRTSPRLTMQQLSVYLAQKLGVLAPDGFIDYEALARHCGSAVVHCDSSQNHNISHSVNAAAPHTARPASPHAIAPMRSLLPIDVFQIYIASDALGTVAAGSRPLHADTTVDKARSQRGAMVFFPLESDVQASLAIQKEQAAVRHAAETALGHAKAASEGLHATATIPAGPTSASDASSTETSLTTDSAPAPPAPVAVLPSNLECWKMAVFAYRIVPLTDLCE
jgi:hypothetical protein